MKKGKKVFVVLLTSAFAIVGFVAIMGANGRASLDGIAKKYGIPTSPDQLKSLNRAAPSENAYPLYVVFRDANKAEVAAIGKNKVTMPSFGTSMAERAEPFDPAKAKDFLDRFPKSLAAAGAMASRPKWYVDRDLSDPSRTIYPEFADLKLAVKLLVLDAQFKLSNGDRNGALNLYARAAKVGSLANSEPVLIGTLVYIACEAIVVNSMAHAAPQMAGDPETVKKAIDILTSIQKPDLARGMKGEGYQDYYLAKNGLPPDFLRLETGDDSDNGGWEPQVALINSTRGFWGPGVLTHEGEVIASAQGNDYARFGTENLREEKWMATSGTAQWVAQLILPVFSQAGMACQRVLALRDLARIGLSAIAAKRLPNVNGTTDPFTGKPYKVVTQANGWRVYSVGMEGVDNGGEIDRKNPTNSKCIVFSYNGQAFLVGR